MYLEPSENGGGLQCIVDYDVPNGAKFVNVLINIFNQDLKTQLETCNFAILKFINEDVSEVTKRISPEYFYSRLYFGQIRFYNNQPDYRFYSTGLPFCGVSLSESNYQFYVQTINGSTDYSNYVVPDGSKIQIWVG